MTKKLGLYEENMHRILTAQPPPRHRHTLAAD